MVRISVVLCTARDDYSLVDLPDVHLFEPTVKSLQKQRFRDFELIVVDGLYHERRGFFKNVGFSVKHLPPKYSPYLERGYWSVCNFFNTGLIHAEGELVVRIDDASEFDENYLQKIWEWYERGLWALSLVVYYRGGKIARYDDLYRQYYIEMYRAYGEMDVDSYEGLEKKLAILDKMFKKGEAIKDSRLPLMEDDVIIAPWSWVYGYVAAPLKVFLEVNGYDEAFDMKKSLEDPDLGLRIELAGYRSRFVLDKSLWVIENLHGPPSEKVIWNRGKPPACNYAILRLHQVKGIWRVNERRFTEEELRFIREETVREPCSHHNGAEYDLDEGFRFWAENIPVFDLREERKKLGL